MALILPECYGENNRLQVRITTAVEIVKCEISLDANPTITVVASIPEPHLSCWKFNNSFVFFLKPRFYLRIMIFRFGSKQCGHRKSARNYSQRSYCKDHEDHVVPGCPARGMMLYWRGTPLFTANLSEKVAIIR